MVVRNRPPEATYARGFLVRLGRKKFHKAPTRKQLKAIQEIADLERLEALASKLLSVASWAELLADPRGTA